MFSGFYASLAVWFIGKLVDTLEGYDRSQRKVLKRICRRAFRDTSAHFATGFKRVRFARFLKRFAKTDDVFKRLITVACKHYADFKKNPAYVAELIYLAEAFARVKEKYPAIDVPAWEGLYTLFSTLSEHIKAEVTNSSLENRFFVNQLEQAMELLQQYKDDTVAFQEYQQTLSKEHEALHDEHMDLHEDHEGLRDDHRLLHDDHDDLAKGQQRIEERIADLNRPDAVTARQLEAPPAHFKGREEELGRVLAAMEATGGQAVISSIGGMGGIGKTALAFVAGDQLKAKYPGAQLQIDLRGVAEEEAVSPEAVMGAVLRAVRPEIPAPEDTDELQKLYRSVLAETQALILLDNAYDALQVKPLICGPPCAFLVTSRRKIILDGRQPVDLDALPPEEALDLLRSMLQEAQPATDEELNTIAELCGRVPLALRAAGAYLAIYTDQSPVDYANALKKERTTTLKRLKVEGHALDVEATLALSARRLCTDHRDWAERWQMLSVFTAPFDLQGAAAVMGVDEEEAQSTLSGLLAWNLLHFDPESRLYNLHDLMRPIAHRALGYAHEGAESEENQEERLESAGLRHARHYMLLLAAADDLFLEGHDDVIKGLTLADDAWDHILAGQAWAAQRLESNPSVATLCNAYPDAGAYIFALRLHNRTRIQWLETAIRAAQRMGDRKSEGNHLNNLGLAYAALGEVKSAIECYEQSLKIKREIGDRRGEGNSLGNLGNAYYRLGEVKHAIEYYEQQLDITREIGDQRGEGNALGSLGNAYRNLGEVKRAIEFYEKNLTIVREIGDRRGEGNSLGNLGNAYRNLGEVKRAIEFYEQRIEIAREIGDRNGEGNVLGNLGNAYADLGEVKRAIELYEQALVIDREIGDRFGEGANLGNLGNAYRNLGEVDRAIECYEQALEIVREIGDRRGEGLTRFNLSLALDSQDKRAEAIPLAQQALAIFEAIENPNAEKVRQKLAEWQEKA